MTTPQWVKVNPHKYSFSRDHWHEAYLEDIYFDHFMDIIEWCILQFGPLPVTPDGWSRWQHTTLRHMTGSAKFDSRRICYFKFRDERDYTLFILRWL